MNSLQPLGRTVIATTTRYPDPNDVRARLAIHSLVSAYRHGLMVVVIDDGSHQDWRARVKDFNNVILLDEQPDPRTAQLSMGAGRRQAMEMAVQLAGPNGVVLWTELEKTDIPGFAAEIAEPIYAGRAGLVIPTRRSLGSYPPEQAAAETQGNLAVQYLLGRPFDFWFGPMAWDVEAIQHVLDYNGLERGYGDRWDSIMVPRLHAMAAGVPVETVTVDYVHPPEQTRQETGNLDFLVKRAEQLVNIVPALRAEVERLGIGGLYAEQNQNTVAAIA